MNKHIVLYTADLHGNEIQYQKLVDFAIKNSVDSVIIGGDIAPKEESEYYLEKQGKFIQNYLLRLIAPLRKQLPKTNFLLFMGNDDCAANTNVLEKNDPEFYRIIHNKRLKLSDDFDIVGYSYVPITPFGLKDWEKFDLTNPTEELKLDYEKRKTRCRFDGYKTDKNGWYRFIFSPEIEKEDSIQKDLKNKIFTNKPQKTVYVIHAPPNRTNLDQIANGEHVGSFAVREFIEKNQPYLTLHGHIHETVDISGKFYDQIGKTLCFSPRNHNVESTLSVIIFDLYDLNNVRRLKL